MDANPNNIPKLQYANLEESNVIPFSNPKLTDKLGFSVAWHWQTVSDWYDIYRVETWKNRRL